MDPPACHATLEGHVAGAGDIGRGGWAPHRRRRLVHRHAQGQGRSGRPQRSRQDHPVQGAGRGHRAHRRPHRSQGRVWVPAPGPTHRRSARHPHRRHPCAQRPRHRRATRPHREAAHRHGGGPQRQERRPLQQGARCVRVRGRLCGRQRGSQHHGWSRPALRPHGTADRRSERRRATSCRTVADPVRRQRPAPAR